MQEPDARFDVQIKIAQETRERLNVAGSDQLSDSIGAICLVLDNAYVNARTDGKAASENDIISLFERRVKNYKEWMQRAPSTLSVISVAIRSRECLLALSGAVYARRVDSVRTRQEGPLSLQGVDELVSTVTQMYFQEKAGVSRAPGGQREGDVYERRAMDTGKDKNATSINIAESVQDKRAVEYEEGLRRTFIQFVQQANLPKEDMQRLQSTQERPPGTTSLYLECTELAKNYFNVEPDPVRRDVEVPLPGAELRALTACIVHILAMLYASCQMLAEGTARDAIGNQRIAEHVQEAFYTGFIKYSRPANLPPGRQGPVEPRVIRWLEGIAPKTARPPPPRGRRQAGQPF